MKKTEEYNEVYGWMPQEVINNLDEIDRKKMFLDWVLRKPTASGWFIVRTVIAELGDGFIEYLLKVITETLDDEEVTKENLVEGLAALLESFATDTNILMQTVSVYREEILGLDDETLEESESEVKKTLPQRDEKGRFVKKQ
jgi:hypothetical protein